MLRLAPSRTPLWRTPTSVQLGLDGAQRVDDVAAWQERVLGVLAEGVTETEIAALADVWDVPRDEVDAFIEQVRPSLRTASASVAVRIDASADIPRRDLGTLVEHLRSAGVDARIDGTPAPHPGNPIVLAVGARLLDPRHAMRLLGSDITHLPLVLAGDRIDVGPLVIPGRTACVACVHARHTDADAAWPVVAAQLLARGPVSTSGPLLLEAAALVARLVRTDASPAGAACAITERSARRTWRVYRPHPDCGCQSLASLAAIRSAKAE